MPEGHTLHRLVRQHLATFGGQELSVSSPQGRFAAGARLLDGRVLSSAQAHGKHLFLGFAEASAGGPAGPDGRDGRAGPTGTARDGRSRAARPDRWLHVHLGLYGAWTFGEGEPPEPRGAVRVRLVGEDAWADLRGPTACDVVPTEEVTRIRSRLGADPLRRDADPDDAGRRIRRSRAPLGALLMQQEFVAGVGNVYRAEALFRGRLDPWMPGTALRADQWDALWADLVLLLRDGVRRGHIVTTLPQDRPRRRAVHLEDRFYVYKRTGLPCRICGTPVVAEPMAARVLYRCPYCQRAAASLSA